MKKIPGQLDIFELTPEDQVAEYYGIIGEGKKKIKITNGEAFYDGEPIEVWNARENETMKELKNAPYFKGLR